MEGTGASLFLGSSLLGFKTGMLAGLCLVCTGVLTLFVHLGHPFRFWRVISKITRSWISRGAVSVAGFIFFVSCLLLFQEGTGTPIIARVIIQTIAYTGVLAVLFYSGFLFSNMSSVPFWNNTILPVLFLFQSLSTGMVLLSVSVRLERESIAQLHNLIVMTLSLMLITLILTWIFSSSTPNSAAAQESARLLKTDPLKTLYFKAVPLSGFAIPSAVLLIFFTGPGLQVSGPVPMLLLLSVAVLRLASDIVHRYIILKVGVHEPHLRTFQQPWYGRR